jgi:hypothetical protein
MAFTLTRTGTNIHNAIVGGNFNPATQTKQDAPLASLLGFVGITNPATGGYASGRSQQDVEKVLLGADLHAESVRILGKPYVSYPSVVG